MNGTTGGKIGMVTKCLTGALLKKPKAVAAASAEVRLEGDFYVIRRFFNPQCIFTINVQIKKKKKKKKKKVRQSDRIGVRIRNLCKLRTLKKNYCSLT